MGHSRWSDDAYQGRQHTRRTTGTSAFTYDNHVRTTGVVEIHPEMDPFGVTRESRDSLEHPESLAIAVIFDVTGSMGTVPRVLQTKLGALMRVLTEKGYVEHPQVLFGAVGDAYCDRVPIQIGQFESGLEMDDELGKIYLEGGGGGQVYETYELGVYFMARHTSIDCFERRGKKGYLFTIGDEKPYDQVHKDHARHHLGDPLRHSLSTKQVVEEVQQRYEYFHIIPTDTSHGQDPQVQAAWKKLLGERVLLLDDAAAVCETIALAIGLCEGTIDNLAKGAVDLAAAGYDPHATASATSALRNVVIKTLPAKRKVAGLLAAPTGHGDDGRY